MASRIDDGADFMAHTVIHTMVVRMQHVADQTGKNIGLIYDLAADRIRFVEIGSSGFDASAIFRVVRPRAADGRASTGHAMTAALPAAG